MNEQDKNVKPLPTTQVTKPLSDDMLPHVSILIPCYLRQKFVPLILMNISQMDYPRDKMEICILQDGPLDLFTCESDKDFFKEVMKPAVLKYVYEPKVRRTIGQKRNKLVKMASHKICANMDSDDIYLPTYLRYSVSALKEFKVGITSSAQMMFCYPKLDYKITAISCGHKHQGHEACAVFTKKHFNSMGGFISRGTNSNQGEGVKMIAYNEKNMVNLDIRYLMICVAHDGEEGNTIPKDQFNEAAEDTTNLDTLPHLKILREMLGSIEGNPESASLDV